MRGQEEEATKRGTYREKRRQEETKKQAILLTWVLFVFVSLSVCVCVCVSCVCEREKMRGDLRAFVSLTLQVCKSRSEKKRKQRKKKSRRSKKRARVLLLWCGGFVVVCFRFNLFHFFFLLLFSVSG